MGYCFIAEDGGRFPRCDGRLIAPQHPELPCAGAGGGDDDRTATCAAFCHTKAEARAVLADWRRQQVAQ